MLWRAHSLLLAGLVLCIAGVNAKAAEREDVRKVINLVFNDNREYDFILRDANGKKLVQWSDDQSVTQGAAYIIINPGERSELVAQISSRDMAPGRTYQLEAHIPGYDALTVVQRIVPQ